MCLEESGKSHPSFACRDKLSRTRFHDSLLSIPSGVDGCHEKAYSDAVSDVYQ